HTEMLHQTARLAGPDLALGGIDAGKRDQHIAVLGGKLGHFLVVVAAIARLALGIDREDDGCHVELAVVFRRFRAGGRMLKGRLEIGRHTGLKVVIAIVSMRAARLLRMGMKIYRDDFVEIWHLFCSLTNRAAATGPASPRPSAEGQVESAFPVRSRSERSALSRPAPGLCDFPPGRGPRR